jgi:hypothetical protein
MAHAPLERTHDSSPNGVGNPGGGVQTLGIFVAFVEDVLLFAEVLDRRVRASPAYRCARRYSPPRTIRAKRLNTARRVRSPTSRTASAARSGARTPMSPILSYAICLVKSHTVYSLDQNICEMPRFAISTRGGDPRGAETPLAPTSHQPLQFHPHGKQTSASRSTSGTTIPGRSSGPRPPRRSSKSSPPTTD